MSDDTAIAARHLRVCERFGQAVVEAAGKWDRPSPCREWDARGVLEHVIGFHDVLLLRPMGAKPHRPRDDPLRRWIATVDALQALLTRRGLFDGPVHVPAVGNNPATQLDTRQLVTALTQDVLVHTWDLARSVGANDRLDQDLCAHYLGVQPDDPDALVASGMFNSPVEASPADDPQTRLLARLGRDPHWRPPSQP
jgi:uncharacterized protein (TIGR03086 family)